MSDIIVPMWTLGERLGKARESARLSTHEMADRLGISERTIRNWEHEATHATRSQVLAYAFITGVPVWWIEDRDPTDDEVATSTKWWTAEGDTDDITLFGSSLVAV